MTLLCTVYYAILEVLSKTKLCQGARRVLNWLGWAGVEHDLHICKIAIMVLLRGSRLDKALKLLERMQIVGEDRMSRAKERLYMKCLIEKGCTPDPNTVSYTALLNGGLCKSGKSSEARDLVDESEWWTPNAITYSGEGDDDDGDEGFFPTPVELNLLLQSLCREGRANEAQKFMVECKSKGLAVNVVNFTSVVIHGYCNKDDLDGALSLLDDMYLNKKHADAVTYTVLVDALAKLNRIEEATELAMEMLKRGILPTPVTYRSVIHRYCQKWQVGRFVETIGENALKTTLYNQVIEKLCCFGYISEAYDLLVACRMFNRNLVPDVKLCEKISKKLILGGNLDEADEIMLRLVERGNTSAVVPVSS
ncbi:hypothetical protein Dimus_016335 [Dionaea muscipula]